MNHRTLAILLVAALAQSPAPATAAARNFGVSGFDRIRVEGPYAVAVSTGVAPFARASGSQSGIDHVAIRVEGTTLIVQQDHGGATGNSSGPVTVTVGTHELAHASVNGVGSIAIDRVHGLSFALSVAGAGQGSIAAVDIDQLRLAMAGSGSARLAGRAASFTAVLRGAASLDAGELMVKDLALTAQGPAVVRATATNTAKISAGGTSTVTLAGKPSCTLKTVGSASVSGCR